MDHRIEYGGRTARTSATDENARALRNVVESSHVGSFVYFINLLAIVLMTNCGRVLPVASLVSLTLLVVVGTLRLLFAIRFKNIYERWPRASRGIFFGLTVMLAGTWGGFAAIIVAHFGAALPTLLTVFSVAGITAGLIAALSSQLWLARTSLLMLTVPTIVAGFVWPGEGTEVVSIFFAVGSLYMLVLTQTHHRQHRDLRESRRKNIEQAKQLRLARDNAEASTRTKSEFLANMSHELRTPLSGIVGAGHLLSDLRVTEEQREYVDTILESGQLLADVIKDILDFSKIEVHGVQLRTEAVDLAGLLADLTRILSLEASRRDIDVSFDCRVDRPCWVSGDAPRLRRIVDNLLDNALKFTQRGSVTVTLDQDACGATDATFRIAVIDTGIGIPAAKLDSIFERYTQADSSSTKAHSGAGLGLAISLGLARVMGGDIEVDSQLDVGSTFTAVLPLPGTSAPVEVECAVADSPLDDDERVLPGRILVVEDNPTNLMIAERSLKRIGCRRVDVAGNGEEAVARMLRSSYDLVFMDCQMPIMDGYEATRQIRRCEGPDRRTPIYALTANAFEADRQKCRDAGMDDFIAKPVTPEELRAALQRWAAVRRSTERAGDMVGSLTPVAG